VGVRIHSRRAQKTKKDIFVSFVNSFIIIFGENKYFEKPQNFCSFN